MTKKTIRTEPEKRLYSLDALRGFDMFWITGGGGLAIILSQMTGAGWLEHQMHHVDWAGFQFEDLIFPLFMFIAGVAIPFSVKGKLEKNVPKRKLFWKVFQRMVVLILLGILYNGTFRRGFGDDGRIASVLGQIGIGYFFAAVIVIYFESFRSRLIWLGGILVGIGIVQLFIPVPGFGAGVLTPEGCINGYLDRLFLPGRLHGGTYDPEGILCSLSATGITLMGTIAGNILRKKKTTDWQKIGYLTAAGAGLIILALVISPFYPIIKKCWTSTFNLLTGGISFLLIAFFYMVIDHWGFRKWAFYFRIIGMNSIFVYLFTRIVDVKTVTEFFLGWLALPLGETGALLLSVGGLAIVWLLLYYMYKKKIFLRV
jgi:predicted acyltransferase